MCLQTSPIPNDQSKRLTEHPCLAKRLGLISSPSLAKDLVLVKEVAFDLTLRSRYRVAKELATAGALIVSLEAFPRAKDPKEMEAVPRESKAKVVEKGLCRKAARAACPLEAREAKAAQSRVAKAVYQRAARLVARPAEHQKAAPLKEPLGST